MEFEIAINDQKYTLQDENGDINVDGKPVNFETVWINRDRLRVFAHNKTFEVEFLESSGKQLRLKVNQKEVRVDIRDHLDLLLEKLGMGIKGATEVAGIDAPMPGTILDILVSQGDEVNEGDPLVILEAMKMENLIKAPANAKVAEIMVQKGDNVEKGRQLLRF